MALESPMFVKCLIFLSMNTFHKISHWVVFCKCHLCYFVLKTKLQVSPNTSSLHNLMAAHYLLWNHFHFSLQFGGSLKNGSSVSTRWSLLRHLKVASASKKEGFTSVAPWPSLVIGMFLEWLHLFDFGPKNGVIFFHFDSMNAWIPFLSPLNPFEHWSNYIYDSSLTLKLFHISVID